MTSESGTREYPELKRWEERDNRNRRLIAAAVVIIVGLVLTILGARMTDQYFDDHDQYQVDELPDLTVGILLTVFGAIMIAVAIVYVLFAVRA